jgi:hypothetical protein
MLCLEGRTWAGCAGMIVLLLVRDRVLCSATGEGLFCVATGEGQGSAFGEGQGFMQWYW